MPTYPWLARHHHFWTRLVSVLFILLTPLEEVSLTDQQFPPMERSGLNEDTCDTKDADKVMTAIGDGCHNDTRTAYGSLFSCNGDRQMRYDRLDGARFFQQSIGLGLPNSIRTLRQRQIADYQYCFPRKHGISTNGLYLGHRPLRRLKFLVMAATSETPDTDSMLTTAADPIESVTSEPKDGGSMDVVGIGVGAVVSALFLFLIVAGLFCRKDCFSSNNVDDKGDEADGVTSDKKMLTTDGKVSPTPSKEQKPTRTETPRVKQVKVQPVMTKRQANNAPVVNNLDKVDSFRQTPRGSSKSTFHHHGVATPRDVVFTTHTPRPQSKPVYIP